MITLAYIVWFVNKEGHVDTADGFIQVMPEEWADSPSKRRIYREVHCRWPEAFAIRIQEVTA